MKYLLTSTIILLFLLFFSSPVLSVPSFSEIRPVNGSYTFGRDTDIFSANVSDPNLNTSSVKLHIRVFETGSTFTNVTLSCLSTGSNSWYCSGSVPGFGSLASDGKTFIFFFDGSDNSGSNSQTTNNFVTIDRTSPQIEAYFPLNGSYIGGNARITFQITDMFSGVNSSSPKYSTDNSSWIALASEGSDRYYAFYNVSALSNGQTITLYVDAIDNVGNKNNTFISTLIDNENPVIILILPSSNQTLQGSNQFQALFEDGYSGIDITKTYLRPIGKPEVTMTCTGTLKSRVCSTNYDTSELSDGQVIFNYETSDNANNSRTNSSSLLVDNFAPNIEISSPASNSQVSKNVEVSFKVTDLGTGVKTVLFRFESDVKTGNWTNISCTGSSTVKNCNYQWNSLETQDGNIVLRINSTDNLDHLASKTVQIVLNNLGSPTTTQTLPPGTVTTTQTNQTATTTQQPKRSPTEIIFEPLRIVTETIKENRLYLALLLIAFVALGIYVLFFRHPSNKYPGYKPKE